MKLPCAEIILRSICGGNVHEISWPEGLSTFNQTLTAAPAVTDSEATVKVSPAPCPRASGARHSEQNTAVKRWNRQPG
ncbi:MAG TPA: hypothetical protein DCQ92_16070 [Verrucomicrobia subdivision 3 bacterium]|nr:hypothetical protein [Limisphaerales bacterium]